MIIVCHVLYITYTYDLCHLCHEKELNATMRAFDELQHSLTLGSPATAERVELRQVDDLCVIRSSLF